MTRLEIINKATRNVHRIGFKFKKHSPEILVVAGVVGTVSSAIIACKATTKLSSILEESKEQIDQIHGYVEGNGYSETYTEEDSKKDLSIVYVQTGVRLAKLYVPAIALGTLSLTAVITSNHILRKRNIALAAAYTAVEKSFKSYRNRVVERFGKELDQELRYNIKAKEIEATVIDEKTGEEKTVKETVNVVDPNTIDDTSRVWYDGDKGWTKDPEYNLMYLKLQQSHANDKLKAQGFLFLNDVYEMLGFPKTAVGAVVGWIYDEKHPIGDNFVDFGLYDIHDEAKRAFVNGKERAVLLEFNHDGNIIDYI